MVSILVMAVLALVAVGACGVCVACVGLLWGDVHDRRQRRAVRAQGAMAIEDNAPGAAADALHKRQQELRNFLKYVGEEQE